MSLYPRLIIAGTHSGVGKTTVTLALLAALKTRGRLVQAFKAGPDFIDPGHHTAATGRPSRNIDGWMLGAEVNRGVFMRAAVDADLSIIEGMMGLFDGSSPVSDIGSTAELAKQLDAPVLLVIDASAMARSAAAMALGYAKFDSHVRVAGVLFNRVGSEGHYRLLKEAVEAETDLVVLGYLKIDPSVTVSDRHLGLVTAVERGSNDFYGRLAKAAMETVDLDRVETLAMSAGALPPAPELIPPNTRAKRNVRVGIAHDPAFCFYYQDNLDLLEAHGAELIKFSPMNDQAVPAVDMLYVAMRQTIRSFGERGGVIYAECGGMMYLTQAIRDFEGKSYEMVGLFDAEAVMRKLGLTLGYRTLTLARECILGVSGVNVRGHEFHYSTLVSSGPLEYACVLSDARGESKGQDGLVMGNVLALYTHLHFGSQPQVAKALVASARQLTGRRSMS